MSSGLRQIKRRGQRGRGLAIAGVTLSTVGTLFVALMITLGVLGVFHEGNTSVENIKVGQCFDTVGSSLSDYSSGSGRRSTTVNVVSCDKSHDAEAFAVFTLDPSLGSYYPGVDQVARQSSEQCASYADQYLNGGQVPDSMGIFYYMPPQGGVGPQRPRGDVLLRQPRRQGERLGEIGRLGHGRRVHRRVVGRVRRRFGRRVGGQRRDRRLEVPHGVTLRGGLAVAYRRLPSCRTRSTPGRGHVAFGEQPAYLRVAEDLRRKILDGTLPPHARLPSQARIRSEYGVSDTVALEARKVLMAEGFVEGRSGSGTYVRERPEPQGIVRSGYRPAGTAEPLPPGAGATRAARAPGSRRACRTRRPWTSPSGCGSSPATG